jgi:hypothetical protein
MLVAVKERFCEAFWERCPNATDVLCDIPSVVAEALKIKGSVVAERCDFVGADMFQTVLAGGDAYILKAIVHDWRDEEAIQILRNCRQGIRDGGKALLIEFVIKPSNQPDFAKWLDLNMLVKLRGRQRTEEEFRDLYTAGGFLSVGSYPRPDIQSLKDVPE